MNPAESSDRRTESTRRGVPERGPLEPIWLLANHGSLGGGEVMVLHLAQAATELGVPVHVVAPDRPTALADAAAAAGHAVTRIAAPGRAAYLSGLAAWRARRRDGLAWCVGLAPALAATGLGRRVVHLHQPPQGSRQRAALTAARAGALAVVVPSAWMAGAVGPIPGLRVLANWVPPVRVGARPADPSTPSPAGADPQRDDGVLRVGYLGRLTVAKGVDLLAEAITELDRARPGGVRLVLAGTPLHAAPGDRARIDAALAPIEHRTERLGWIDRARFFGQIDLAVFPSRRPEPFGLVAAEAMSAGVPFVISDAGALPEVAGTQHPFVFPAGSLPSAVRMIDIAGRATGNGATVAPILARSQQRWLREFSPAAGRARFGELLVDLGVRARGLYG